MNFQKKKKKIKSKHMKHVYYSEKNGPENDCVREARGHSLLEKLVMQQTVSRIRDHKRMSIPKLKGKRKIGKIRKYQLRKKSPVAFSTSVL